MKLQNIKKRQYKWIALLFPIPRATRNKQTYNFNVSLQFREANRANKSSAHILRSQKRVREYFPWSAHQDPIYYWMVRTPTAKTVWRIIIWNMVLDHEKGSLTVKKCGWSWNTVLDHEKGSLIVKKGSWLWNRVLDYDSYNIIM